MIKLSLVAALLAALGATAVAAPVEPSIVTASERGTYIQIGRDLAKYVAQPAGIPLKVLPSKGSADNIRKLRDQPGVRLALVQSDVYQAFVDQAQAGNADATRLIKPLRVVMPLYDEEIHAVVRADSPLNFLHEIKDKRINIGPIGSGTALSATTLYRLMFNTGIAEKNTTFMTNEDALLKLVTDRSIDVAFIIAGQPAKLFSEMKPEARKYIKLLRVNPEAPETKAALATYFESDLLAASYPSWLAENVPTLTTKALLVTYDFQSPKPKGLLTNFARSLCIHFKELKTEGHAKWQEVKMSLPPLGKGWSYYGPTQGELLRCESTRFSPVALEPAAPSTAACSQNQKVLGLCK